MISEELHELVNDQLMKQAESGKFKQIIFNLKEKTAKTHLKESQFHSASNPILKNIGLKHSERSSSEISPISVVNNIKRSRNVNGSYRTRTDFDDEVFGNIIPKRSNASISNASLASKSAAASLGVGRGTSSPPHGSISSFDDEHSVQSNSHSSRGLRAVASPNSSHGHKGLSSPNSSHGQRGVSSTNSFHGQRGVSSPNSSHGQRGVSSPNSSHGQRGAYRKNSESLESMSRITDDTSFNKDDNGSVGSLGSCTHPSGAHPHSAHYHHVHGSPSKIIKIDKEMFLPTRVNTPEALAKHRAKRLVEDTMHELDALSQAGTKHSVSSMTANVYLEELQKDYKSELSSFGSVALFAEMRLREVLEKDRQPNRGPSLLVAVVVADLLKKVTRILGRYENTLNPLIDHLLNCVFRNYFKLLDDGKQRNVDMPTLWHAGTYFDHADSLESELVETNLELKMFNEGASMRDVMDKFQTVRAAFDNRTKLIRDACFNTWKSYTQMMVLRRQVRRVNKLRTIWVRWQQYMMIERRQIPDDLEALGINPVLIRELFKIKDEERIKKEQEAENAVAQIIEQTKDDPNKEAEERLAKQRSDLEEYKERMKEKLKVVVVHRENAETQTDYDWLEALRQEIIESFTRYVEEEEEVKKHRKPSSQAAKMAVETAVGLVAQIYEYTCAALIMVPTSDFDVKAFQEFVKELLIIRYGVKKIAMTNMKAIERCCSESQDNKRLQLFAYLYGIPTKQSPQNGYSPERCKLFFRIMVLLFPQPAKNVTLAFKTDAVEQQVAAEVMRTVFADALDKRAPDAVPLLAKGFHELHTSSKVENGKPVVRVSIDELLGLFIKFFEYLVDEAPTSDVSGPFEDEDGDDDG